MAQAAAQQNEKQPSSIQQTAKSYARGMAGSLLVAMPLLATMEMWWLGFYMEPYKLILFLLITFGVLIILEYYSGFQQSVSLSGEIRDAFSAYGIGFVMAAVVLFSFHLLRPTMPLQEILGKIILQSIPLSIGASVAISQLGENNPSGEERMQRSGFWGAEAVSLAGALYFGFNIAPTVEPMMLGLKMTWWTTLLLIFLSLIQVHAIVFSLGFRGGSQRPEKRSWMEHVLYRSVTTYAVALLLSAYLLWTFGRLDADTGFLPALHMIVVLGFVNSLGAAAAKLIL